MELDKSILMKKLSLHCLEFAGDLFERKRGAALRMRINEKDLLMFNCFRYSFQIGTINFDANFGFSIAGWHFYITNMDDQWQVSMPVEIDNTRTELVPWIGAA